MLNEKLLKAINDTVKGIQEQAINLEDLDRTIDYILEDNGIYKIIEDENGEDIDNPKYEEIFNEVYKAIKADDRLQVFNTDIYAYEGEIKNLNIALICDKKYESPFEALEVEM